MWLYDYDCNRTNNVLITISFQSDREKWQIIFGINAVILPIGGLIYVLYGQMTVQPWNTRDEKEEKQVSA